jgi:hypothetical protein
MANEVRNLESQAEVETAWLGRYKGGEYTRPPVYRIEVRKPKSGEVIWTVTAWYETREGARRVSVGALSPKEWQARLAADLEADFQDYLAARGDFLMPW